MTEKMEKTVLIVDDDDLLREFYTRVLGDQGYNVVCAGDGDKAIAILDKRSGNISLVIADLLMPVRTGWELIEYMRSRPHLAKIPIIAITGLAGSNREFAQVKQICAAVLHKGDFDLTKFKAVIERVLRGTTEGAE